jgi:hypothetical protein
VVIWLALTSGVCRGRIATAQISIVLGVGAFLFILEALPRILNGTDFWTAGIVYGMSLFSAGILSIGGTGAACNLPIILNCLPETHRTSGVGLERFFASVFTSLGGPLVGLIAEEYFGYRISEDEPAEFGGEITIEGDLSAAAAPSAEGVAFLPLSSQRAMVLGHSLALLATVAWLLSCAMWSALYFTYGRDRLAQVSLSPLPPFSAGSPRGVRPESLSVSFHH